MKHLISLIFISISTLSLAQTIETKATYPKIAGYASVVHPIVFFNPNNTTLNFSDSYTVGFPMGINILKSDRIGFSLEITPFIRVDDETDKVTTLMFHPGIMFRRKHGFTINTRMAFETSGRFGPTLVFSKVVYKSDQLNYFIATPIGFRFGNQIMPAGSIGIQLGVSF